MGKQKKARKYATMKRMLSLRDESLKKNRLKPKKKKKEDSSALKERETCHPYFQIIYVLYFDKNLGSRITQSKFSS
uniref:Uncharacterized protein n=1 Tax=Castor canadensis TaxID=51338 RepID=A0A8C0XT84_CASCN